MTRRSDPNTPEVSVVIPTFDRLPLLRQAIDSVLAQTFQAWELIVVDDGSTDGTLAYLAGLTDPRVRTIAREHTGNVAQVRNAGAAVARGRYLAFLDSDDLWLPRKLEVQLDHLRAWGGAWSHTRYDHIDEHGRPAPWATGGWHPASGWIAGALLDSEAGVSPSTVIVSRELFEEVGGFAERPWPMHEDLHLAVRIALRAPVQPVDEVLALFRQHAGRTTTVAGDGWIRYAATYGALLPYLKDRRLRRRARRLRAHYLTELGRRHLRERAYGPGLRRLGQALFTGPDPVHWCKAVIGGLVGIRSIQERGGDRGAVRVPPNSGAGRDPEGS